MTCAMAFTDTAENRPQQVDPFAEVRKSLGPGYDWLFEFARQLYRPALGVIVLGGLARCWWLGAQMDEFSLGALVMLAGTLAGIRAAEMFSNRFGR